MFAAVIITQRRLHMDFSQIERLLAENGWSLIRTLGSARQYKKTGIEKPLVITNHGLSLPVSVVENLEKTGLSGND